MYVCMYVCNKLASLQGSLMVGNCPVLSCPVLPSHIPSHFFFCLSTRTTKQNLPRDLVGEE